MDNQHKTASISMGPRSGVKGLRKTVSTALAGLRIPPIITEQKFDFLGYTFRLRGAKDCGGKFFVGFNPAVSNEAAKSMRETMRQWRLHRQTDKSLDELAHMINPVVRGWIKLLWQLLQVSLIPHLSTPEQYSCQVGYPEIQKIEGS
jgi:hypothetical protein